MKNQFAIIGIGNSLRGDDGIGEYIVAAIERLQIKNVKTFIVHQLHIELLEELKNFNSVIFVDASLKDEEFIFQEIKDSPSAIVSYSHRISPETFVQLSKKLYSQSLKFYICAIKGHCFEMGKEISFHAKNNAQKAIEIILSFIQS